MKLMAPPNYEEHLAKLMEACNQGNLPALFEIVMWCKEWNVPLPRGAHDELAKIVLEKFSTPASGKGKKEYRRSQYQRSYDTHRIAFERWREVQKARCLAIIKTGSVNSLAVALSTTYLPPAMPPARKAGRPKKGDAKPSAWLDQAVAEASEKLRGTIAWGSKRQIIDDYIAVESAKATGDWARYNFAGSEPLPKTSADLG